MKSGPFSWVRPWLILAVPALGGIALVVLSFLFSGEPSSWTFLALTAGWGLLFFGTLLLLLLRYLLPLRRFLVHEISHLHRGIRELAGTMTRFAQGNLTDTVLKPLPLSSGQQYSGIVGHFFAAYTDLAKLTNEAGHDAHRVTGVPSKRLCFVGGDTFAQGRVSGDLVGKALDNRGKVLISTGFLHSTGQEARRKGFIEALEEHYPHIQVVETVENRENSENAYETILAALKRNPDISAIYVTEGSTPPATAKAVGDAGRAGKTQIFCHDLVDETMMLVQNGLISTTLGDNTFAQGHDPVMHLYNHLAGGWSPNVPRLIIAPDIVSKTNCAQFWQAGSGLLVTQAILDRLAKPLTSTPPRPLKIAVLGCENSPYWYPVRDGAKRAAEALAPYSVRVDWIAPKGVDLTAEVCGPLIEQFVKEGYDGIAVIADDSELTPYINQAVKDGVAVITFITEPLSLRGFIAMATEQAKRLSNLNVGLLENMQKVASASSDVRSAMGKMSSGTATQTSQMEDTRATLNSLIEDIKKVDTKAEESRGGAESSAQKIASGTGAMEFSLESLKTIEESVSRTWDLVEDLSHHSLQIFDIVDLINDIVSRVNLLAFNAAIEATRAGAAGKGFKVIADEIRNLSSTTSEATRQITEQITAVRDDIGNVKSLMQESLEKVRSSSGQTDQAVKALTEIRIISSQEKERLIDIARAIDSIVGFARSVTEAMNQTTAISQENAGSFETINQAIQQMESEFQQVVLATGQLEEVASIQQLLLSKFTGG